jgi:hypothetical protein
MLYVPMPEVVLNQSRIRALIRQSEAAGMAEHVGMGGQGQPGQLPIAADRRPSRAAVEWPAPFADEEIIRYRFHGFPLLESRLDEPEFIRPQRVGGR